MKAQSSLGVVFFPAFDWAIHPLHPEREERLLYTLDQLNEEGIFDVEGITQYKPGLATQEDIMRTHFCFPDVSSVTTESHLISAGGTIKAAALVLDKIVKKSFALVRPPGHHAMKVVHGARGFCNINIEAVMVEYIRENYPVKKIAIVDTDCHHGDGTQDIYWHDKDILYISLHQDGRTLYPGTGAIHELGGPNALGTTINIPLPPNTSDEGFLMAMERVVLPILKDFNPDIIVNSAGQDNHYSDPITNMNFSASGYAQLTDMLNADIAVLEGGYSIQGALPYVNLGITLAMAGLDYSYVHEPDYAIKDLTQDREITKYIKKLCDKVLQRYEECKKPSFKLMPGNYDVRKKEIYYDTDNIHEMQLESIMVCDQCRGVLKIETTSSVNPLCLGIEIPSGACDQCINEGYRLLDHALAGNRYKYVQLIDRINKKYVMY
ncbi:MAG TPA: histone deacetylase [Spirochaetota bacterium]|nr:histone deacetylase [Spirochaetota bacterium]